MRATRRAARDDPDPQIHAKETILHLLRLLSQYLPHNKILSRSASLRRRLEPRIARFEIKMLAKARKPSRSQVQMPASTTAPSAPLFMPRS